MNRATSTPRPRWVRSSEHSVLLSQRYLHTCHPRGGVALLLLKGMVMSLDFHTFAEKLFSHHCFLEGLATWMGQCFYFLLIASPSSKHGYCRDRFNKNTSMQVGVLEALAYSASGSETAFTGTCGHWDRRFSDPMTKEKNPCSSQRDIVCSQWQSRLPHSVWKSVTIFAMSRAKAL